MNRQLTRSEIRKFIMETVQTDQVNEDWTSDPLGAASRALTGLASDASEMMGGKRLPEHMKEIENITLRTINAELNASLDEMIKENADMISNEIAKVIMDEAGTAIDVVNLKNKAFGSPLITQKSLKKEVKEYLISAKDPMIQCVEIIAMKIVKNIREEYLPYEKYVRENKSFY